MHTLRIVKLIALGLLLHSCFVAAADESLLDKGKSLLQSLTGNDAAQALSAGEIEAGLREALRVGTRNVVKKVGATDGFNKDPAIHIPLPESLQSVHAALGTIGLGGMLDDVELRLNRAAEVAAPRARKLFVEAIAQMTMDDAKRIYDGPDDAATQYFKGKMSAKQMGEQFKHVGKKMRYQLIKDYVINIPKCKQYFLAFLLTHKDKTFFKL